MKKSHIAVLDLESSGLSPVSVGEYKKAQITEISITMMDANTLEISKNNTFNSLVWIEQDLDRCEELGLEPLSDKLAEKTHKNKDELLKAPKEEIVWEKMKQFLTKFKTGNSKWNRPILSGWNVSGYDRKLLDERCRRYKDWDEKTQQNTLFSPKLEIDMMYFYYLLVENIPSVNSISLDNARTMYDLPSTDLNHTAKIDTLETALILQKNMRWLRKLSSRKKFEGTMSNTNINDYL
jgi:DNA polymerase III epsilon subunit-like protein